MPINQFNRHIFAMVGRIYLITIMMHISMILDPDACVYDARMYVACIYDPRSLTLIHVCMMDISMILDPDPCLYDAYIYDPDACVQ